VTLLSILGTHSIALPLSPAFPPHELQYIMDHSQASMLLSSDKFERKAVEVLKQGLEGSPKHVKLEKKLGGATYKKVTLEGPKNGAGGMMLYTSGTTNRPVSAASKSRRPIDLHILRKESCSPNP
jgi:malonyl-CoA/methylmalonyl-CoA synthetase